MIDAHFYQCRLILISVHLLFIFFLFLKLEENEELVESRLKLNCISRNGYESLMFSAFFPLKY